ncbi:MAG: carboxymuconolactone decarboxylase family protein [Hungatella sp.]|nr:carboxymuconolactone decarboxylase family protein [Hungatella sp.]
MDKHGVSNAFRTFGEDASGHAQAWMDAVKKLGAASKLDKKTEALAYIAVLAAARLETGIPFHVKQAKRYQASRDEIISAVLVGLPAVGNLVDRGVKVIGIDSYGFDRPFTDMMNDYFRTSDSRYLFPAHFFGREKCYCHVERLANLGKLPGPYGFKVSCLPVKIKGAGASWTRVVAIL